VIPRGPILYPRISSDRSPIGYRAGVRREVPHRLGMLDSPMARTRSGANAAATGPTSAWRRRPIADCTSCPFVRPSFSIMYELFARLPSAGHDRVRRSFSNCSKGRARVRVLGNTAAQQQYTRTHPSALGPLSPAPRDLPRDTRLEPQTASQQIVSPRFPASRCGAGRRSPCDRRCSSGASDSMGGSSLAGQSKGLWLCIQFIEEAVPIARLSVLSFVRRPRIVVRSFAHRPPSDGGVHR
jgi:hypothetical protein